MHWKSRSCSSLKAVTLISYLFCKCFESDLPAEKFIKIIMTVTTILSRPYPIKITEVRNYKKYVFSKVSSVRL